MANEYFQHNQSVVPYFRIEGAQKFIEFLQKAFNAVVTYKYEEEGKILYSELKIGNTYLELSDANEKYPALKFAMHFFVEDADAGYKQAVEAGCTSIMEPADQDYGERVSVVDDPFGNQWYIAKKL